MGDIYWFGILVTWTLLGAAWVYGLIACLIVYARAFVNDEKVNGSPFWFIPDSGRNYEYLRHAGGDTIFALLCGLFFGFVGGFAWVIIWPTAMVAGGLFGARKFVRFGKKLDNHRHEEDGSVKE